MSQTDFEIIRRLYMEAVALPPAEREAFLVAAGPAPEVRKEVEELLGYETDPRAPSSIGAPSLVEATAAPPIPETIAGYRVLRLIGEGGMGAVYEAEQESPRRRVALKLLRHGLASEETRRRFEIESELLGRLQHPAVAQIFEAGHDDAVGPFIAMEYVEGATLDAWRREAAPDLRPRLELWAAICDGVQHAHRRGIIHRDLKPGNILVEVGGQPKILDFGIARVADDERSLASRTRFGEVIGTIAYMSPEQASGDPDRIDTRSDVYALGILGHELITGTLPHDLARRSIPEAMNLIATTPVPRPRRDHPGIDPALETVLLAALELEVDRRYGSAADLAADIRRHLADEPVAAHPPSTWYQVRMFGRRHRTLVASAAIILVVALAAVVGILRFAFESDRQAERASREARRAETQRGAAERNAYTNRIRAALAALDGGRREEARRLLEGAAPELRGWEWRHLHARLDDCDRLFDVPLTGAFAFNDRGRLLLVHADKTLRTGRDEVLSPLAPDLVAAAFAPEGRHLALAYFDGRVEIHALDEDGKLSALVASRVLDEGAPRGLDCGPGGRMVVIRGEGYTSVWDHGKNRMTAIRPGPGLAFDPVSARAMNCDQDLIDLDTAAVAGRLTATRERVTCVAFDPKGERVALGTTHPAIIVHDLATETRRDYLRGSRATIRALAWSPDGAWLFSGDDQGTVDRWDLLRDRLAESLLGHDDPVLRLAVSREQKRLVVAAATERALRFWRLGGTRAAVVRDEHGSYVHEGLFSPDGRLLATAGWDRHVRIWNGFDLTPRESLGRGMRGPTGLTWERDGEHLTMCAGRRHRYRFRVPRNGERATSVPKRPLDERPWDANSAWPGRVGLPASDILRRRGLRLEVLKNAKRVLRVVDARSEVVRSLEFESRIERSAVDAEERRLAIGRSDGVIEILDLEDWSRSTRLAGHVGAVFALRFSPDGERLVSGGADRVIRLWDTASWSEVGALRGHEGDVRALSFSPDGGRLVSTGSDGTVRLWSDRPRHEAHADAAELPPVAAPLALPAPNEPPTITAASESRFGSVLAAFPALSADQEPMLLVGAAHARPMRAGRVELWSLDPPRRVWRTAEGHPGELGGSAVVALSDLDGDGLPEVAVGCPGASEPDRTACGRVDILSGADGRVIRSITGGLEKAALGRELIRTPDLDGDGHADLVCVPDRRRGRFYPGKVLLVSPVTGETLREWPLPSGRYDSFVLVREGEELAIVVTSSRQPCLRMALNGDVEPLRFEIPDDLEGEILGAASVRAGNDDVVSAILVGAPKPLREERTLVFPGSATRAPWRYRPLRNVVGPPHRLGDFDGDGVDDIGVSYRGRFRTDQAVGQTGRLAIISGADGRELEIRASAAGHVSYGRQALIIGDRLIIAAPRAPAPYVEIHPLPVVDR